MVGRKFIWGVVFILPFFSCGNDEQVMDDIESEPDGIIEKIDLSNQLGLDSGEVKMFTMPTPLQVATALRIMNVDYNADLLLPNDQIGVCSDIDLSLGLGMYLTDLGYTTVYNNTQKSFLYAKDIQYIMEELPIPMYVNDGFNQRFKSNMDNQDSLCKIILEGYNVANQHISEFENEGLGLLVLTGAYVEGLYLASASEVSIQWLDEHNSLFVQQKLFLDNFILLLEGYESNAKIARVLTELKELKKIFDQIDVSFNNEKEKFELSKPISTDLRNEIGNQITIMRNNMASNISDHNS